MSNRLALSAAVSVMMMAIYVLFGTDAAHVPFGPAPIDASLTLPELTERPVVLFRH